MTRAIFRHTVVRFLDLRQDAGAKGRVSWWLGWVSGVSETWVRSRSRGGTWRAPPGVLVARADSFVVHHLHGTW
jgi:hypothetical protein